MLDVIGAGATATATQDWYVYNYSSSTSADGDQQRHETWRNSPESKDTQHQLENMHAEGRGRPPVAATLHTEFATSWYNQFIVLLKRDMLFRWRDPTYLIAKLVLNIVGGLFIGVCLPTLMVARLTLLTVHVLESKGYSARNAKQAFCKCSNSAMMQ